MELVYLPDPMTRFSALNAYRTWEEYDYRNKYSKTQKSYECKEAKTSEKTCSICQQKKKRILSDYIKSKQLNYRNTTSIQEEDEEAEGSGSIPAETGNQKSYSSVSELVQSSN